MPQLCPRVDLPHFPELYKQLIEEIICNDIIEINTRLDELLRKGGFTISEHAVFTSALAKRKKTGGTVLFLPSDTDGL